VPKITDEVVEAELVSLGLDAAQARNIAHFADGDWGLALQLSRAEDPNLALAHSFQEWMRACYAKDMGKLAKWTDAMHQESRDDQKRFLKYALDQIRHNLMLNYVGEALVRQNETERTFSSKFARFINDTNVEEMMEQIEDAYTDVSRNAYSKMVLLDLSVKMYYLLNRAR
jgi:DNA polymerase-3 subunit delta'